MTSHMSVVEFLTCRIMPTLLAATSDEDDFTDAVGLAPTFVDVLHCIDNIWRFFCAGDNVVGDVLAYVAVLTRRLLLLGSKKVHKKSNDFFSL